MANQPVVRRTFSFSAKAAQCPNCFSFNSPDYLPEKKQQKRDTGLLLTCATCGTAYEFSIPRAA
jgi:transcription elongation factor Elf1